MNTHINLDKYFIKFFLPAATLIGGSILIFVFCMSCITFIDARNWDEKPCIIIEDSFDVSVKFDKRTKEVKSTSATYTAKYGYEVNSKDYISNRLNISSDNTKEKIYTEGMETVCYVNPADPTVSVLDRSFPVQDIPNVLLGLLLWIIGFGTLLYVHKKKEKDISHKNGILNE